MITELIVVATVLDFTPLSVPNHEVRGQDIIILDTGGGWINSFATKFAEWEHQGKFLIITGKCNSACTMALGNPKSCAMPKAYFGFHQARDHKGEPSEHGNFVMWSYYPDKVRRAVGKLTDDLKVFKATDFIPLCLFSI